MTCSLGLPQHATLPDHPAEAEAFLKRALDVAARLDDLRIPAGNRLERLRGARSDRHSMRINDRYRLTFRWEDGHAYEVRVEDYH